MYIPNASQNSVTPDISKNRAILKNPAAIVRDKD